MRTVLSSLLLAPSLFAQTGPQRPPLHLDDLYQLRTVSDPQRSPDGQWVAYTVSTVDTRKDKNVSHIWLVSWDGKQERQLTFSDGGENMPRWSPDGGRLAFLSARSDACEMSQVWLLPMSGGEAARATELRQQISDYAWSRP